MLRCAFALELRRVLRMTHSDHIALFAHFTAIKRGRDLAARIGFTDANRETQISHFGGATRNRFQSARYAGARSIQVEMRETQNG
jgi:hypothetical protein